MPIATNDKGVVEITLPHHLAVLSIIPDDFAETGFRFEISANDAGVTIDEFGFVMRRALDRWVVRMSRPGYEPSPIIALGQELSALIPDSQMTSIPAAPPAVDDSDNPIIY